MNLDMTVKRDVATAIVTLSSEESRRFAKAMRDPFVPNAKLKNALERGAILRREKPRQ